MGSVCTVLYGVMWWCCVAEAVFGGGAVSKRIERGREGGRKSLPIPRVPPPGIGSPPFSGSWRGDRAAPPRANELARSDRHHHHHTTSNPPTHTKDPTEREQARQIERVSTPNTHSIKGRFSPEKYRENGENRGVTEHYIPGTHLPLDRHILYSHISIYINRHNRLCFASNRP